MKQSIVFLGILLLAGTGCKERKKMGQGSVVMHYQYVEPGEDEPFNGERSFYYPSGEIRQKVIYKNGYPEVMTHYYRSGQKKSKLVVDKEGLGDLETQMAWFESGQKKFESLDGVAREWYENGQLKALVHYNRNDELHGVTKVWYRDGTLKGMENYEHSKLNGERIKWDENGEKVLTEKYHNGKLIESVEI